MQNRAVFDRCIAVQLAVLTVHQVLAPADGSFALLPRNSLP